MATTEEMVAGDGWISDDSSFYGDEDEQEHQESLSNQATPKACWSSHSKDLNAIVSPAKLQARKEAASDVDATPTKKAMPLTTSTRANKLPGSSGLDRKAMEDERLARLAKSKRKRDTSPEAPPRRDLFNPMEGQPFSWQLGETADAFVKRVPPFSTSALTCEWIWAVNPHRDLRDKSASPRGAAFKDRGTKLLADSLQRRNEIQEKGRLGPRSTVTRAWNQETRALQQSLTKLAVETGVLSGKWMLFPKAEEVTHTWKTVVEAVITDRLGPTAKVAPDDGKDERLICVYTKDFRDEDDVLRVLQELEDLDLLQHGRGIYYKSDAFTHLDLYSATANKYGLQASLYTSQKMLAAAQAAQLSMSQNTASQQERKVLKCFY
ncbi:uncharacterized protein EKO05_0001044 [Ascochyta rabiei]|uniref:Uncharacterized protein n=1 Tax=Didymella rabiei TaxID=5454 RepID=A0A163EPU3_DIDRA|nr:uncharacterized protein EKO05_0001044 [Ascochyta rabiei]KZM23831.1 hypothetical protein ST47_g5021 [Ascochyta rabiei]UPX10381.1 hypothetical protein EKO05_0001044 [Ascochyta rabiei]